MHLSASIGTGEAPMNATALRIALARQRHNVLPQLIEAGDALGQTAPFKNADLDLGYIEPTAMDAACNAPPVVARCAALPRPQPPRKASPPSGRPNSPSHPEPL